VNHLTLKGGGFGHFYCTPFFLGSAETMARRNISWTNWSLCDKDETFAALHPSAFCEAVWTQEDLSQSSQFVFPRF